MARLALPLFVLMVAVVALTEGIRGYGPKKCCFVFNEKPVAKARVVRYDRTSQRCSQPGILLTTVAGRQLCAQPSSTWVKELISHLDTKPGKTSSL